MTATANDILARTFSPVVLGSSAPVSFEDYLTGATTRTTKCGQYTITEGDQGFSIKGVELGAQQYDYRGAYTHAYCNYHLTRMRNEKYKLFKTSLRPLLYDDVDVLCLVHEYFAMPEEDKATYHNHYYMGTCLDMVAFTRKVV